MGHKERKRTNQAVPFGFSIRKGKGIRRWFSHSLILSQAFLLPPLFFFYVFLFFFLFSLVFACSFIVPLTGELHGRQWGLYMIMLPFFIVFFRIPFLPSLVFRCLFYATTVGHFCVAATAVVHMAALHRDAMHQWRWGDAMFWGVRSFRIVSTLMPKCGLG